MADTPRDQMMRVAGQLLAACNLLEHLNVPHDQRLVHNLVENGATLIRKAMLAAWESADNGGAES